MLLEMRFPFGLERISCLWTAIWHSKASDHLTAHVTDCPYPLQAHGRISPEAEKVHAQYTVSTNLSLHDQRSSPSPPFNRWNAAPFNARQDVSKQS